MTKDPTDLHNAAIDLGNRLADAAKKHGLGCDDPRFIQTAVAGYCLAHGLTLLPQQIDYMVRRTRMQALRYA